MKYLLITIMLFICVGCDKMPATKGDLKQTDIVVAKMATTQNKQAQLQVQQAGALVVLTEAVIAGIPNLTPETKKALQDNANTGIQATPTIVSETESNAKEAHANVQRKTGMFAGLELEKAWPLIRPFLTVISSALGMPPGSAESILGACTALYLWWRGRKTAGTLTKEKEEAVVKENKEWEEYHDLEVTSLKKEIATLKKDLLVTERLRPESAADWNKVENELRAEGKI